MAMINFEYICPKKYQVNLGDLEKALEKCHFSELMSQKFFPEIKTPLKIIVIHRKNLGFAARFHKNKIYFNFSNPWDWGFRCLAHEATHILLRAVNWEDTEGYQKIKRIPRQKGKDFIHEYDQSTAILTQAYFENLLHLRKFVWKEWHSTFEYMDVGETGKSLFDKYKKFFVVDNKSSVIHWINTLNIPS